MVLFSSLRQWDSSVGCHGHDTTRIYNTVIFVLLADHIMAFRVGAVRTRGAGNTWRPHYASVITHVADRWCH